MLDPSSTHNRFRGYFYDKYKTNMNQETKNFFKTNIPRKVLGKRTDTEE